MKKMVSACVVLFFIITVSGCTLGKARGGKPILVSYECSDQIDNDQDGFCDWLGQKRCKDGSKVGDPDCTDQFKKESSTGYCGDGLCTAPENCQTCASDCIKSGQVCCNAVVYNGNCCIDSNCASGYKCMANTCTASCGNNVCDSSETDYNCAADCLKNCSNTVRRYFEKPIIAPGVETDVYLAVCAQSSIGFKDSYYAVSDSYPLGFMIVSADVGVSVINAGSVKFYRLNITQPEIKSIYKYRLKAPVIASLYTFNGSFFFENIELTTISGSQTINVVNS